MILIDPPLWPAHGTVFSHLVSDTSLDELHAFAQQIGLPPAAFDRDHYDIPERLYHRAVSHGAVEVRSPELVRRLRASGLRVTKQQHTAELWQQADRLLQRWHRLLPEAPELGRRVLDRWCEQHRRYHTMEHLAESLDALRLLAGNEVPFGRFPRAVWLAAWFHDAVYDPVAADNEERSAALAEELLDGVVPGAEVEETARLVRLTRDHDPETDDEAGTALTDADLSILGSTPRRYRSYVRQVQAEYRMVPPEQFRVGRRQVVEHLLALEPRFHTSAGFRTWRATSGRNLSEELADLTD
ncbi:DUF4031 domain-containing protein [Enemella sp. A6]|uniref:DUF4031 domain-containing protein n=1 Tax=Enemella sp. A6 TaxID=3440152 RepID=UPI003EBECF1D